MNHTERLTRYTANFVDELVCSGLRHVVISPGSRSTPLAMLFSEHEEIEQHVLIDERSAAYFALGIAKETQKATAIVCTSGTAAANYFPAIVEAYYARVPIIVLTADRPHELRGIGASQTINQINMYGDFVKHFHEMALPESTPEMLKYVRAKAARAVREAEQGEPGPVHLNFPFREPLVPDFTLDELWGNRNGACYNNFFEGKKRLYKDQVKELSNRLLGKQRGLLVCGPQTDKALKKAITTLSARLNIPVLADPLSQLRAGSHDTSTVISTYDALFRFKWMREKLKPDYIIRFGAMPISKNYLFFIEENADVPQFVVEDYETMREPTNHESEYIFANGATFCEDLLSVIEHDQPDDSSWLSLWTKFDKLVSKEISQATNSDLTEGEAVRELVRVIPDGSRLFVANSMPVRDLDTFFMNEKKQITVHANRGVSGIDGTVSSALGVAAATTEPVTLIVGDLSFYHDLNSLLAAKHYEIDITILLINNNGGGIFSFLPQANEKKHFEALFGTPLHIDFNQAVTMYGGKYELITSIEELQKNAILSYNERGLTVLEVQTNRDENVRWHKDLWNQIERRLKEND